jgi:hypothetical protein
VSAIAERSPLIEHLNLSGCHNVSFDGELLNSAALSLKHITFLDVSGLYRLYSIAPITQNAIHLRTIRASESSICQYGLIHPKSLKLVGEGAPLYNLEELDVSKCEYLFPGPIFWMLSAGRCPNLKVLRMSGIGREDQPDDGEPAYADDLIPRVSRFLTCITGI